MSPNTKRIYITKARKEAVLLALKQAHQEGWSSLVTSRIASRASLDNQITLYVLQRLSTEGQVQRVGYTTLEVIWTAHSELPDDQEVTV